MTRELFTLLSDEHAQALLGGSDVCNGNDDANANVNADFVNTAHGLGCCHQDGQQTGDTAEDRHGFAATVTNSGGQTVQWGNTSKIPV